MHVDGERLGRSWVGTSYAISGGLIRRTNSWGQACNIAGGIERSNAVKGDEEDTQLTQRASLDGNRYEGRTLVQECFWTGNDLRARKYKM